MGGWCPPQSARGGHCLAPFPLYLGTSWTTLHHPPLVWQNFTSNWPCYHHLHIGLDLRHWMYQKLNNHLVNQSYKHYHLSILGLRLDLLLLASACLFFWKEMDHFLGSPRLDHQGGIPFSFLMFVGLSWISGVDLVNFVSDPFIQFLDFFHSLVGFKTWFLI